MQLDRYCSRISRRVETNHFEVILLLGRPDDARISRRVETGREE